MLVEIKIWFQNGSSAYFSCGVFVISDGDISFIELYENASGGLIARFNLNVIAGYQVIRKDQ